jgi:hypothetical protein
MLISFVVIGFLIFGLLMLMLEVGFRVGRRGAENADPGLRAIDGFAFATLGFMLSFSLYSGNSRLDQKRSESIQQVNALKVIVRRANLVPTEGKEPLQAAARRYAQAVVLITDSGFVESQSKAYEAETAARAELKATAYGLAKKYKEDPYVRSVLDAVDEVASLAARSRIDDSHHVPLVVYGVLLSLSTICALLAGRLFRISRREQMPHRVVFSLLVAAILLATVDYDNPTKGLITTNDTEKLLQEIGR